MNQPKDSTSEKADYHKMLENVPTTEAGAVVHAVFRRFDLAANRWDEDHPVTKLLSAALTAAAELAIREVATSS